MQAWAEDGDGWGLEGDSICACAPRDIYVGDAPGDCDDTLGTVNPGATEVCDPDDTDEDCDVDEDGWCAAGLDVSDPAPAICPGGGGDCDDLNPDVHPAATDGCGLDWNCDGALLATTFGAPSEPPVGRVTE